MVKSKKKSNPTKPKSDGTKVKFVGAPSHSITPFLMFNANLEEVAKFYKSIFKKSKIITANPMQATFILNGQKFFAYNGGPEFQFSWGVSFMISVETQKEVDYYTNALLAGHSFTHKYGMILTTDTH
ncbi:MAG: VOC family protein [Leptospiraceae bacterium]|nr:VOC family protein [Leptospiraceae bacterium]MCP5493458.1 VOC family protein [Leptospiraceae bacterium]